MFKSGFVTIVGKPNSGKSTLINKIIGKKVSIVSYRKNTTRNQIRGIYNDSDSQIVFTDTPGFLKAKNRLDSLMQKSIVESLDGIDVILYLMPFYEEIDNDYFKKIALFKNSETKKILLLTKADLAENKEQILEKDLKIREMKIFDDVIPISSVKEVNIDVVIKEIKKHLKEDINYYDKNSKTDYSDEFYVAEIVREKALYTLEEEIPHRLFVKTESIKNKKDIIVIKADIIIDAKPIKKIIIGEDGQTLKRIGTFARKELEMHFNKKVFLELFVKVKEDWKNKDSIIREI